MHTTYLSTINFTPYLNFKGRYGLPIYSNLWLKAQILNKLGKNAEALPVAQKALTLGNATPDGAFTSFYKGQIEKGITQMQSKVAAAPAVTKPASKGKKKK